MAMAMASPSPVQRQRCLWTPCVAPDAPLRVRRELHGAAGAAAGFAAAALRPRASRRFPRRGAKDPAVPAATVSLPEAEEGEKVGISNPQPCWQDLARFFVGKLQGKLLSCPFDGLERSKQNELGSLKFSVLISGNT